MSEFQSRQPKGVPIGGQFAATARGETGTALGGPATGPTDHVHALSELMDTYVAGFPHVADEAAAIAQITPHVPSRVAEALWQDALQGHLHRDDTARTAALQKIADWEAREARWRNDPAFVSPTYDVTEQGTNGPVVYTTAVGGKYTGWRDVASIAKDVRTDLKAAQAAGYLPADLKFAVVTDKYAGGQSMRVRVQGMSDDDIYEEDPTSWSSGRRYAQPALEIRERVVAIAGAYGRDTTDIQTDYFNVTYYSFVDLEDEQGAAWREQQAAARKAARASR